MQAGIEKDMFNLPVKILNYPYRMWDVRRHWENDSTMYTEFAPIQSVPDLPPGTAWQADAATIPIQYHYPMLFKFVKISHFVTKKTSDFRG